MDGLADTLFSDEHIPLIVLVADKIKEVGNFFETTDVQIVDGLQRTTRLQALYVAVQEKFSQPIGSTKYPKISCAQAQWGQK